VTTTSEHDANVAPSLSKRNAGSVAIRIAGDDTPRHPT
jgi:hypothetical protein